MKPSDLLRYAVSGLILGGILLLLGTQLIGQPAVVFVETGSMAPTLEPNDGYLAVPMLFAGDIGTGDVILFDSQELGGGELTTHRVDDVTDRGYITKGDANPFTDQSADEPPVSDGQIRSVALEVGGDIVVIPGLGASVGVIRDGLRLFQDTILAPLGIDAEATSISTGALIAGLLLFAYGTVSGATDRYNRSRTRGGLLSNAVVVITILTLVVIIPVNVSMLLPSGVYQYEILSSEAPSENPQVIGVGESSDVTYAMRNSGFIPTLVFLEPASDGVTIPESQIYVPAQSTIETSITMQAPDEPGNYPRFVQEYRYLVLLPPSLLAALHVIHPALAIITINLVAGSLVAGVAVTSVGTDRFRFRSQTRELELGDEVRRLLPGVLFSVGGSTSKPEPPAPPATSPPPAQSAAEPPVTGPPSEGAATGSDHLDEPPVGAATSDSDPAATPPDTTTDTTADTADEPRDTLTDTELVTVHTALNESPTEAGLDAESWSIPLLQRMLFERYNVDYPREECGQLLERAGVDPDSSHVPSEDSATVDDSSPRRHLTDAERVAVQETLTESPADAGLDAAEWTRPLLQRYLFETYAVDYPRELCLKLLEDAEQEPDAEGSVDDETEKADPSREEDETDDDWEGVDDGDRNTADGDWEAIDGDDWSDSGTGSDAEMGGSNSGGWGSDDGLTDAQFMDVFTTVQAPPDAVDIDADTWTPAALQTYLADAHGIDYPEEECMSLLDEIDNPEDG